MSEYTGSALAYVAFQRQPDRASTWMDVARAYDEGMRHALQNRRSAGRYSQAEAKCTVCGFAERMAIHQPTLIHGKPTGPVYGHTFSSLPGACHNVET